MSSSCGLVGWSARAAKKLRGGSALRARWRISSRGMRARASRTSSFLWSMICRSALGTERATAGLVQSGVRFGVVWVLGVLVMGGAAMGAAGGPGRVAEASSSVEAGGGGALGWALLGGVLVWAAVGAGVVWRRGLWRMRVRDAAGSDAGVVAHVAGEERRVGGFELLVGAALVWVLMMMAAGVAAIVVGLVAGDDGGGLARGGGPGLLGLGVIQWASAGAGVLAFWVLAGSVLPGALGAVGAAGGGWWRGWRSGVAGWLLVMPVILVVSFPVSWLERWVRGEEGEAVVHSTLRQMVSESGDVGWWLVFLGVVVAAPVVEELIYRGLVQTGMVRLVGAGRGWLAVVLTSVLFSAVHAGSVDAASGFVLLFVVGMVLGVIRERTGSLGGAIVFHGLFNATNVGIAMAQSSFG